MRLVVPGTPRAQPRPRVFGRGRVVSNSDASAEFKASIRVAFLRCRDRTKLSGPVRMTIDAIFSRKKHTGDLAPYIGRPDGDNIAKAVKDALNGLAYDDDSQVCELIVRKMVGGPGCEQTVITINGV